MSTGDTKDWNEFNCSQEHEFTYVKNLYSKSSDVYKWLKESCANGKLNSSTHREIYQMLENEGFVKK
jgi:hypothetical protein